MPERPSAPIEETPAAAAASAAPSEASAQTIDSSGNYTEAPVPVAEMQADVAKALAGAKLPDLKFSKPQTELSQETDAAQREMTDAKSMAPQNEAFVRETDAAQSMMVEAQQSDLTVSREPTGPILNTQETAKPSLAQRVGAFFTQPEEKAPEAANTNADKEMLLPGEKPVLGKPMIEPRFAAADKTYYNRLVREGKANEAVDFAKERGVNLTSEAIGNADWDKFFPGNKAEQAQDEKTPAVKQEAAMPSPEKARAVKEGVDKMFAQDREADLAQAEKSLGAKWKDRLFKASDWWGNISKRQEGEKLLAYWKRDWKNISKKMAIGSAVGAVGAGVGLGAGALIGGGGWAAVVGAYTARRLVAGVPGVLTGMYTYSQLKGAQEKGSTSWMARHPKSAAVGMASVGTLVGLGASKAVSEIMSVTGADHAFREFAVGLWNKIPSLGSGTLHENIAQNGGVIGKAPTAIGGGGIAGDFHRDLAQNGGQMGVPPQGFEGEGGIPGELHHDLAQNGGQMGASPQGYVGYERQFDAPSSGPMEQQPNVTIGEVNGGKTTYWGPSPTGENVAQNGGQMGASPQGYAGYERQFDAAPPGGAPAAETFTHDPSLEHDVKPGDNVWRFLGQDLDKRMTDPTLRKLTTEHRNFIINALKNHLAEMERTDPDKLRNIIGVKSGNIDLIHPGEHLDFNKLFQEPGLMDKIMNDASHLPARDMAAIHQHLNPSAPLIAPEVAPKAPVTMPAWQEAVPPTPFTPDHLAGTAPEYVPPQPEYAPPQPVYAPPQEAYYPQAGQPLYYEQPGYRPFPVGPRSYYYERPPLGINLEFLFGHHHANWNHGIGRPGLPRPGLVPRTWVHSATNHIVNQHFEHTSAPAWDQFKNVRAHDVRAVTGPGGHIDAGGAARLGVSPEHVQAAHATMAEVQQHTGVRPQVGETVHDYTDRAVRTNIAEQAARPNTSSYVTAGTVRVETAPAAAVNHNALPANSGLTRTTGSGAPPIGMNNNLPRGGLPRTSGPLSGAPKR